MNMENMRKLPEDPELVKAIQESSRRKMTPAEMMEQRASFVYASIKNREGMTKDIIKRHIIETEGTVATNDSA